MVANYFDYLVLGSGRQGLAGAYYLAAHGHAKTITIADWSMDRAIKGSELINKLTNSNIAKPVQIDVRNQEALIQLMRGHHGVFSAVSYEFNLPIFKACIAAKICGIDLGGNTPVVFEQLKLFDEAKRSAITLVPDCGLAPGLSNILAKDLLQKFPEIEDLRAYCGGLPQEKVGPLDYKLVFSVRGLTNEYFGTAYVIENGQRKEVPTFSGLETLEFPPPLGTLEAFRTTGGSSTCPWSFEGRLKNFEYKTLRYPGHFSKMKCLLDLGYLDEEPLSLGDFKIIPRELFHVLAEKKLQYGEIQDLVVLRVVGHSQDCTYQYDLIDYQDSFTGFSAMERTTAFPAALVLIQILTKRPRHGVLRLEDSLETDSYVNELIQSGLEISKIDKRPQLKTAQI